MSKIWNRTIGIVPCFAVFLSLSTKTIAAESHIKKTSRQQQGLTAEITTKEKASSQNFYFNTHDSKVFLTQGISVKQFQDIKPTDWSYEALKNLIDRYGCISGFSERIYKGEKNITRAEFAAGLNNCLIKIEQIIYNSEHISEADVTNVLRLMQEYQSDLAILQARTDGSQARLEDLEATQFSATSKLQGEAVVGLSGILFEDEERTVLGSRLRLELETSFLGDDRLLTRLSNTDFSGFAQEIGTFEGELAFAEPGQDNFQLEVLQYNFELGNKVKFIVGAIGTEADDIASTINFLDGDGGAGAVSDFGTRNPIYRPSGNAGLGIVHNPVEQIEISAGYLASDTSNSNPGSGLFDGAYSALGQVTITPLDNLNLAATYIHSYNQSDTGTGTNQANLRSLSGALLGSEVPTVSNSYGLELSWSVSDRLVIGAWGGLSKVSNLSSVEQQLDRGTQDIWNWATTLALPDLGKEGSLAGVVIGSEPKVTSSSIETAGFGKDEQNSLHLEAFYQYQINDNIAVTPGLIWITEPEGNNLDAENLVIGTVRTTLSF